MREIALDTETTGLNPASGHRIVEIGCVEMINHVTTGNNLQLYINPERDMPEEAFRVHGLSNEFLSDKPVFADVAQDFLDFVQDSPLIIHNAQFDMGFINYELKQLGLAEIPLDRTVDTVTMARQKFPGAQANLDALCKRFNIDNSNRSLHGALLDSELLAEVYLELIGGRQQGLDLAADRATENQQEVETVIAADRPVGKTRSYAPTEAELAAHQQFLEKIKDPIWSR